MEKSNKFSIPGYIIYYVTYVWEKARSGSTILIKRELNHHQLKASSKATFK